MTACSRQDAAALRRQRTPRTPKQAETKHGEGLIVMADFFIRRPIVAMVIAILTVIVGFISLKRLPIAEYPPVSPTMIQVTTTYRGAAAEAVMESVATPIESKVNGVDKLLYMQSYNANDGKLTLNVYFDVGTDVDIMQVNAQNRVGQAEAQLPDAVKREGVVVNRSSPDILMVIGLSLAERHLRRGLSRQLLRHQPGGCHQARARRGRREEFHRAGLLDARLAAARQAGFARHHAARHRERHQGTERSITRRTHRRRARARGAGKAVQRPRAWAC